MACAVQIRLFQWVRVPPGDVAPAGSVEKNAPDYIDLSVHGGLEKVIRRDSISGDAQCRSTRTSSIGAFSGSLKIPC